MNVYYSHVRQPAMVVTALGAAPNARLPIINRRCDSVNQIFTTRVVLLFVAMLLVLLTQQSRADNVCDLRVDSIFVDDLESAASSAAAVAPNLYDIGTPTLSEIFVSPSGNDLNSGNSTATPVRTLNEAWSRVPSTTSGIGYRINLMPGSYPCEPGEPDACFNYFESRHGSLTAPIIMRAYGGPGSVIIRGGLNLHNVHYLYLIDLTLLGGGALPTNGAGNDLLHLDASDYVLLRGLVVKGPNCASDACNNLQETFKANQVQHLYVENSEFGGAWHTVVDYFAVQFGHFLNNRVHTAGQWCMYVKGGSAYLRVEGNELSACTLGFQAGQSDNFKVMVPPYLHYEAYDVKFINNVLHDLPGTGMSVSGGYDILLAYNTLYHVATDPTTSYGLIQLVTGQRNCSLTEDGETEAQASAICHALTGDGGWGPYAYLVTEPMESEPPHAIPNQNVFVYNNIAYNPTGEHTAAQHFVVDGPISSPALFLNLPGGTLHADDNLVFTGNVIWNGPSDGVALGVGDVACLPMPDGNPTCNPSLITANNAINTIQPTFVNPLSCDYRLAASPSFTVARPAPSFPAWATFTPSVATGTLANGVGFDRRGLSRSAVNPPGAFFTP